MRNGPDIDDSWQSVLSLVDMDKKNEGSFAQLAAPGYFNDPDEVIRKRFLSACFLCLTQTYFQLIIGDFGLSREEERSHFAFWCLMASPLLMSVDLRSINPESKALLLNKHAIAINQDARGAQGQFRKQVSDPPVLSSRRKHYPDFSSAG